MSVFGWCGDGFHEGGEYDYGTPCPGRTGDGKACECRCHTGQMGVQRDRMEGHKNGPDRVALTNSTGA